jgi:hypothetical protein
LQNALVATLEVFDDMKRVEILWIDAMTLQHLCGKVALQ